MATPVSSDDEANSPGSAAPVSWAGFAVTLVVLLAVMVGSIYYPYPNGKHLDFWGFVALWAREVLILGLLAFVGVFLAASWIIRKIQSKWGGKNAL